jgi:hypothetical protein
MKPVVASGTIRVCQKDCTLGNGRCRLGLSVLSLGYGTSTQTCSLVPAKSQLTNVECQALQGSSML